MTSRRFVVSLIALVSLAGLVGAACGGGQAEPLTAPVPEAGGSAAAPAPATGGDGEVGGVPPGQLPALLGEFQLPVVGVRVVKTASVTVELKEGSFEKSAQAATLTAARHGGFVASSRTRGSELLSGTIVLRIPADQFEAVLGELKTLGKVRAEEISGQDVTSQFVDLQARLRNWEAQEGVLLGLMSKAGSIDDSIKVQRTLQDVQLAIEEIRGQLRVLTDQTDLSTVTLSLAEVGAVELAETGPLHRAWRAAVDGSVAVLTAIVIGAGYLVPVVLVVGLIGLLLGVAWLVYRRVRQRQVQIS